ncbi:hypothetical protein CQ14_33715 [Bradyrhizobium lablabi]|uniref:Uncharacterized protein n=1 Tax=Bradyrhizobium lablabi TaxID=722472 RepID=A0A0R3NAG1_9BRAD|nr:hypothetical protein CQ14_33715 [Bradyrhizobium lablabi]
MGTLESHDPNADQITYLNGPAAGAGRCRAMQHHPATALQATSASLAIPTAIAFAAFTQRILVEASRSQFGAHVRPNRSPAGLPISAAISFASLSQRVLVFAGKP